MSLETVKTLAEILESLATAAGLAVGGWWAYRRFIRQREESPKVAVDHVLMHKAIEEGQLLHVLVKLSNTGKILVPMTLLKIIVRRVLPLDSETSSRIRGNRQLPEIDRHVRTWPEAKACLEPSELQTLSFYFVLPSTLLLAEIETYFEDALAKNGTGWTHRSLVTFSPGSQQEDAPMVVHAEKKVAGVVTTIPEPPTPPGPEPKEPDPDSG